MHVSSVKKVRIEVSKKYGIDVPVGYVDVEIRSYYKFKSHTSFMHWGVAIQPPLHGKLVQFTVVV